MPRQLILAALLGGIGWMSGCQGPDDAAAFERIERLQRQRAVVAPMAPGAANGQPATQPAPAGPADGPLPELTDSSRLGDYLAHAALNNAGLRAAFERWKAALEKVPQVRALPDPRFTYRYYIVEVETRVGPQRQGFALAQTFPWFGKLALRGDAAAQAAEAQRERFEAVKLALFFRVKDAYYEYYYLGRAIAILDDNIQLLKNLESVARTRYKAATAAHSEVIRAQVELGKLDDRQRTLRDLRRPIVARLNAAMNRPPAAELPWPKDLAEQNVAFRDADALAWLEQDNPELKALAHEIDRSRTGVALARKEYFPDVMLGVDYIDTGAARGGMARPSDSGNDPVIASVSVNLPIWWDKLAAGVREARYRHLFALHSRTEKLNDLRSRLELVRYNYRDAQRKIDLYRNTLVPKAVESIKASLTSFEDGKAGFLDVIDAERVMLEFQLSMERALASRQQHLAEMEMLVGRQLPPAGNAATRPAVQEQGKPATRPATAPDQRR